MSETQELEIPAFQNIISSVKPEDEGSLNESQLEDMHFDEDFGDVIEMETTRITDHTEETKEEKDKSLTSLAWMEPVDIAMQSHSGQDEFIY